MRKKTPSYTSTYDERSLKVELKTGLPAIDARAAARISVGVVKGLDLV